MDRVGGWWRTLFRRGEAPPGAAAASVPPDDVVYAIGDVHGELDLLEELLALIAADAARFQPEQRITLILLGDYVDRGPDSRGVLDLLCRDPLPGATLRCLRGNHEDALLAFLEQPETGRDWLRFGGAETLASYGLIAPPGTNDSARLRALSQGLRERLPEAHASFLRGTRLFESIGDYVFVHAGIRPGLSLERQSPRDLMWIREGFIDRPFPAPPVIVHGHTIVDSPELLPHRIAIDTGAFATGILSAVRLRGGDRHVIQARR